MIDPLFYDLTLGVVLANGVLGLYLMGRHIWRTRKE